MICRGFCDCPKVSRGWRGVVCSWYGLDLNQDELYKTLKCICSESFARRGPFTRKNVERMGQAHSLHKLSSEWDTGSFA